jgi:hypothetical protein
VNEHAEIALDPALTRYRDGARTSPAYADLHEHVLTLARQNLLVEVSEPINKDTEMHPLVRWQYRSGPAYYFDEVIVQRDQSRPADPARPAALDGGTADEDR